MARIPSYLADKRAIIVLILVILALAGSLVAVYVDLRSDNANLSLKIDELQALVRELQANLTRIPSAVQVYNQTKSSVVLIATDKGQGSGFIYDFQGHIVTNNHVVQDATNINVTFSDGITEPAQTIGTPDVYSDLALIRVSNLPAESKPLPIRNSTSLMVGETVYAIGNPFGLANSITMGIVSQLERVKKFSDLEEPVPSPIGNYSMPDIIQFDASVNTGNSGGPLLDSGGNVIGITFSIETDSTGMNGFIGIGYAVPSIMILRVISALESIGHYDHPWAGIEYDPHYTNGAYITNVIVGGPADKAGLQAGDVIEQVNGVNMNSGVEFVTYLERYRSPIDTINLKISLNGITIDKTLTLEARNSTEISP
jgi:S1-C subfamily serine protease